MKKFQFEGKLETIKYLKNRQKNFFCVPDFFQLNKKDIKLRKIYSIKKIIKFAKNQPIILRSSSSNEDQQNISNAGKFNSYAVLNLNFENIEKNLKKILSEMKNGYSKIIVQKLITKPDISGVIFTRGINDNSPYYSINYSTDRKTDSITSGLKNKNIKNQIIFNKYNYKSKFSKLLKIIKTIEDLTLSKRLDIEFAIKNNKIYIFQVRQLKKVKSSKILDTKILDSLVNIKKKISYLKKKNHTLSGKTSFFSNMADWNPAEMIGSKPTPMSLSLYSELITDEVWRINRSKYGYKDVGPNPLMINFLGMPYIDLRTDFNSFLPKNLNSKISDKIINFSLAKIKKKPELHDKIEFEILETCYDFSTAKKLNYLSKNEKKTFIKKLRDQTNTILKGSLLNQDIKLINKLTKKINMLTKSSLSPIQKVYFLVYYCKKYGTLPFAGIARCAFISTKLLKSLQDKKVIDHEDLEKFYNSINNISIKMNNNLYKNKNNKNNFLKLYGHLRPSTYSISSKNYRENYNEYFNINSLNLKKVKKFSFSKSQNYRISSLLKKHKLKIDAIKLQQFAKKSIYNREYAKLTFSKCIDEIFNNLILLGKEIKIKRNDFEMSSIKDFLRYYNNLDTEKLKTRLKNSIQKNKISFNLMKLIDNPDLIFDENDFYYFENKAKKGNFITKEIVNGEILKFSTKIKNFNQMNNKIILIENADPGYDFIFSYKVKALITKYGGANSHMSIRCLENKIPAIIGIGSSEYNNILNFKTININCFQKNYNKLS